MSRRRKCDHCGQEDDGTVKNCIVQKCGKCDDEIAALNGAEGIAQGRAEVLDALNVWWKDAEFAPSFVALPVWIEKQREAKK